MLRAIIYGIDQFWQCPSIEGRERIWSRYGGLFQNCVAVMDASEHPIRIVKSKELEISTYPDYYYLHLSVNKLAIPIKMSSFFWSSSNELLLLPLHPPLDFQHQLALYRLRDPMCTGQAFFTQIMNSIFPLNVKTSINWLKTVGTLSGIVSAPRLQN